MKINQRTRSVHTPKAARRSHRGMDQAFCDWLDFVIRGRVYVENQQNCTTLVSFKSSGR